MAKQTVNHNEAITMRKFGFTYKQIAERLGCSVPWCASNLSNIKVNDLYMDTAYKLFKEQANESCPMCGTYFVSNKESGHFMSCETDILTGDKYCSNRCLSHYLLEKRMEEVMGKGS